MKKEIVNGVAKTKTSSQKEDGGLTIKVIITVIVVMYFTALSTAYGPMKAGLIPSVAFSNAPSTGAVGVLLLLILINVIVKLLGKTTAFSRRELNMVYWMSTVGGLMIQQGLMRFLPLNVMAWQKWIQLIGIDADVYRPFYDGFSSLIMPKSEEAAHGFWLGGATVPWGEWIIPMIIWTIFFTVVAFFVMCLANLVYRQWSEAEHLNYPLTKPIIALLEEKGVQEQTKEQSIWKDNVALIGMAIGGLLLSGLGGLNHYFEVVPAIPLEIDISDFVRQIRSTTVLQALGSGIRFTEIVQINPLAMAFGWFVGLDLLFSMWFLYMFNQIIKIILVSSFGPMAVSPWHYNHQYMSLGAYFGLVIGILYISRHSIMAMFRSVKNGEVSDGFDKLMSDKVTVIGAILSLIFIIVFSNIFLNISILWGVIFFMVFSCLVIGFARVRGEGGLPVARMMTAVFPYSVLRAMVGAEAFGDKNAAGMNFFVPLHQGNFASLGIITHEAAYCTDAIKVRKKGLVSGLLIAFVIAMIVGWIVYIPMAYRLGAGGYSSETQMLGEFFTRVFVGDYARFAEDPEPLQLAYIGGAAFLAILTGYLRSMLLWWPIHPIGVVTMYAREIEPLWASFFLIWLVKWLALRYGGTYALYRGQKFVLGFIIGNVAVTIIFSVIGIVLGY